ncbi:hypothetical protein [Baekduia sp. Peel2402]|uniref:hypothetical protein n=1 Tax=Baekduia sp. Peel2402 TaxID=3458296 RepID=UPI00403EEDD1
MGAPSTVAVAAAALFAASLATTISSAYGADGPVPTASCTGAPQITDASGDGHHSGTDVLSAWLTEGAGRLQAVVQVRAGLFAPEHDDAELNGTGYALAFDLGGATRYVRVRAAPGGGTLSYDYGTYSGGAFTSLGTTTGSVVHATGAGTATIDVPAALGAIPGSVLARPFVVTYDGITAGVPDWVDHAPGGTDPNDAARGADYTVGACGGGNGPGTGGGPGPGGGGGTTAPASPITAVVLSVPTARTGAGRILVTGRVNPARAGVDVAIDRTAHGKTTTSHVTTDADGAFALAATVTEATRVRATAGGISSGTETVDMRSRTTVAVKRTKGGAVTLSGAVTPKLPGRALLLRVGSPSTTASRAVTGGRFAFRFKNGHVPRGRFQVVYVPSSQRAERSTSRAVRLG